MSDPVYRAMAAMKSAILSGERWTDDMEDLYADARDALAAVPAHTPGALDVERLARAMGSTGECGHSSCPRDTSRHDDEARAIAAAYEAASPSEETR